MADEMKLNTESSTSETVPGRTEALLCKSCSANGNQTAADVFCSDCDAFQCSNCSKIHNIYAFMKNHKLVNAKEAESKPVSFDIKGLDQCDQHKELVKLYCEDEDLLCCSTCAVLSHRKCHSVVEIQTLAQQLGSTGSGLKTKLLKIKSKAELIVKKTQLSEEQLHHDSEEIPNILSNMQDKVNGLFEELKLSVTSEAKAFQSNIESLLTKKQSYFENHVAEVANQLETIDNVYQNGTPTQRFIIEHLLKDQVNELHNMVMETCKNSATVNVSFDFDETLKLPPRPVNEYTPGKLKTKYEVSAVHLEKMTSIDLKQTEDDVREPLYTGLDFLPDGRLVAVDNCNEKILIFNEKLTKIGSHKCTSYSPQSIVAVSDEMVAITSGKAYKLGYFRVGKSNEITLISTFEVTTMYDSICMMDDLNFLVGTIADARHLRMVCRSGEEKDFNINFPNKMYYSGSSACTFMKSLDKVALTDTIEHTVFIYDIENDTKITVKDGQIKGPRDLAVGPSDCIFVCSLERNSIVQITPTGRVLTAHKLDMTYPITVGVSTGRSMLAVTNACSGKKTLQLFKLKDI